MENIQPEKENIWIVLSEKISIEKKSFILSKDINTFTNIIFEIAKFSNVGGSNKFKILKIQESFLKLRPNSLFNSTIMKNHILIIMMYTLS